VLQAAAAELIGNRSMSESRDEPQNLSASPRRLLLALGIASAILLIAWLFTSHVGRVIGARHSPLEQAVQIELELVRANLGYELILNGDPTVSRDLVEQYLVRADWYAQQMVYVCSSKEGRLFLAPMTSLRAKLAILRVELSNFARLTRQRWVAIDESAGKAEPDPLYDEAFRQLALRSREAKAAADQVIQIEQGVMTSLQVLLVIGVFALAGFVGMTLLRNVNRLRQIETTLSELRQRFDCLYRDSSDAIMLLDENNFFDCNEATLRMFHLETYKDFRRKHPGDLSPPQQPDGSDSVELANEQIAEALRLGNHRFEWTHRRVDGSDFPAQVLLSAIQIEGRRVIQAVVRDVTQHKESEARLRSNEEKLRTISDAALDAVVMMDAQGSAVHWNPAAQKMFGYTAEEVLGRDIHQLLAPERLRGTANDALQYFFGTGQGRAVGRIIELQAIRRDGEEFPIEISLAPIRIDGDWCAVAVIRDITERKLAEQKLRDEQHTLRRLLKAHDQERKLIAYEIHDGLAQQLIAGIMQCQASIGRGPEHWTAPQELLDTLRKCLGETRRLISGLRPPILDEFGVVTAIENLLEETRQGGGPEIEFHSDVAFDRLEPVLENTIYRVIQESLTNACRHSQSARVMIELHEQDGSIRVLVQDWGVGFDPQQVDRTHYGLAGMRERARLLGGDVFVDSRPGEGTAVRVTLPVDVGDIAD
jgi:PAS domain S-box-containing protein